MKTDFSPKFNYIPIVPLIGAVAGIAQAIGGRRQARKAERQLEKLQSPTYSRNQGILDYYNQALSRYNVSPTDSAMYKRQMNNIGRGVATGISSLQDRRSGQAGIASILRAQNDASLNAEVAAEGEKNRRFGELGNATQLKAGEDRLAFDINEQQPFERKYNLLSQKAGAGNQTANAGLSNIFSGLQNLNMTNMYNNEYGNSGRSGSSSQTSSTVSNPNVGVNTEWLMRNRPRRRSILGG